MILSYSSSWNEADQLTFTLVPSIHMWVFTLRSWANFKWLLTPMQDLNNYLVPISSDLYKCVSDLFSASQFAVAKVSSNCCSLWKTLKKGIKYRKKRELQHLAQVEKVSIIEYQKSVTLFNNVPTVGRFIQKYPIYIIKCWCDIWSSYDISVHLEMLNEFHDYQNIKTEITKITNQFLDQVGLAREKVDVEPKSKRAKVDKTTSRKETANPYVAHSIASSHSHVSDIVQGEQQQQQQLQQQQQPEYLTWWDPNKQTLFYIDPITGNRYFLEINFGLRVHLILCSCIAFYRPRYCHNHHHRPHQI